MLYASRQICFSVHFFEKTESEINTYWFQLRLTTPRIRNPIDYNANLKNMIRYIIIHIIAYYFIA